MTDLFATLEKLVAFESVTPHDNGCQLWLAEQLHQLGFEIQHLPRGRVNNMIASIGTGSPVFAFAGHTDVVTPGDLALWQFSPYTLTEHDGYYYGRGTADMKGSLAAFFHACKTCLAEKKLTGTILWLITSAEEGDDYLDGTPEIMKALQAQSQAIDFCLVGEPSSKQQVGDLIRIGRRGSLGCKLKIIGKQGHVAYPHLAKNPIHNANGFIQDLLAVDWDQGNQHFPKTSLQISHIQAGDPTATNVIPSTMTVHFNLRYSPEIDANQIQTRITDLLEQHGLKYDIEWRHSGDPFYTKPGKLTDIISNAIESVQGFQPEFSTAGGTSDGRFIAPYGIDVIELGLCNETIHQVNERIEKQSLTDLYRVYYQILCSL